MNIRGAGGAISGLVIGIAIIIIVVFMLPLGFSEVSSADEGARLEATDGINAELANCLFATSDDFLEYFSEARPLGSFPGHYVIMRRVNLATVYAEVVCENDYKFYNLPQ